MNRSTRAIAVAIAAGWFALATTLTAAAQDLPPPNTEPPPPSSPPSPAPPELPPASSPTDFPAPPVAPPPGAAPPAPQSSPPAPAVQSETAPVPMAAEPHAAKPILPEWLDGVTLGAGVLLWYYQPIAPRAAGVENNVSVFWARLLVDGNWGALHFHLEPRFRDTPLRTLSATVPTTAGGGASVLTYAQDNQAWLQEAYGQLDFDPAYARLKVGKEYSHLGYFWDNSFYGNVQVYDGLKLDPDYGVSLEGDLGKAGDPLGFGYWAQYFVVDGSTNVSLPARDTISVLGARRRNQAIVRLEPRVKLGPVAVAAGASGEFLQADLPAPVRSQDVWRGALDATLTVGGLQILGEVQHQKGRTVIGFPLPFDAASGTPGSSDHVDYAQIGGEYTLGPVTARYYVSLGSYNDVPLPGGGTVTHKEWLHVPALGVALSPRFYLLGELVFWQHDTPASSTLVDRSFNLTLSAHL